MRRWSLALASITVAAVAVFVFQGWDRFRARSPWRCCSASHKASFIPEHLRMFIRYGPQTFEHDGYRRQLRKALRGYWLFLYKKRLFRRPLHPAFLEFHREAIQKISREAPDDPMVRQWMDRCWRCLQSREETEMTTGLNTSLELIAA
jgi:hypothetical protein